MRCEICEMGDYTDFIHTGTYVDGKKKIQEKYHICGYCLTNILDWLFNYIRKRNKVFPQSITAQRLLEYLEKKEVSK